MIIFFAELQKIHFRALNQEAKESGTKEKASVKAHLSHEPQQEEKQN